MEYFPWNATDYKTGTNLQGNPCSISHGIPISHRGKFHIFPHGIPWGIKPGLFFCRITSFCLTGFFLELLQAVLVPKIEPPRITAAVTGPHSFVVHQLTPDRRNAAHFMLHLC